MAISPNSITIIIFTLFIPFILSPSFSQPLTTTFYHHSCPQFDHIMQQTTTDKQITSPTTAGASLRLFFHGCLVDGCDASVLISSTPFNRAERDADIKLSLPGDGFDVVVRTKTALELACPDVVSCSDILVVATRNLVTMMGGPYYTVKLGWRDGLTSRVDAILPKPSMSMNKIINIFKSIGLSVEEMVALTGAHRSDRAMAMDRRTRLFVELYARDQKAFFEAFVRAVEKLSLYGVKTGGNGEIRQRCDSMKEVM